GSPTGSAHATCAFLRQPLGMMSPPKEQPAWQSPSTLSFVVSDIGRRRGGSPSSFIRDVLTRTHRRRASAGGGAVGSHRHDSEPLIAFSSGRGGSTSAST